MADAGTLLAALSDPRFYLTGDEDGCVGLGCSDCWDGGRPLAYYDRHPGPTPTYPETEVTAVTTIPALWDAAAHHLTTAHPVT